MAEPIIHRRKKAAEFPVTENAAIVVTVVVLLLFAAIRLDHSVCMRNTARAEADLHRIYQHEQNYLQKVGHYGEADEIGFRESYPFSGIIYSVKLDSVGFTAFAAEMPSHDAFGDNLPGNEYYSVNEKDIISHGTFSTADSSSQ